MPYLKQNTTNLKMDRFPAVFHPAQESSLSAKHCESVKMICVPHLKIGYWSVSNQGTPFLLTIPSNREYSAPRLRMMFHEVEEIIGRAITVDEWNKLGQPSLPADREKLRPPKSAFCSVLRQRSPSTLGVGLSRERRAFPGARASRPRSQDRDPSASRSRPQGANDRKVICELESDPLHGNSPEQPNVESGSSPFTRQRARSDDRRLSFPTGFRFFRREA